MDTYRVSKIRCKELREKCRSNNPEFNKLIRKALEKSDCIWMEDIIMQYIKRRTRKERTLCMLELEKAPCNADTYRLYRTKFFYNLEILYYGNHIETKAKRRKKDKCSFES